MYYFQEVFGGAIALNDNIHNYTPSIPYKILNRYSDKGSDTLTQNKLNSFIKNLKNDDIFQVEFPLYKDVIKRDNDFYTNEPIVDRFKYNKIASELGLNIIDSVEITSYNNLKKFDTKGYKWWIKSNVTDISTCLYSESCIGQFSNVEYPILLQKDIKAKFEATIQFMVFNGHFCILGCSTNYPTITDSGPKVGDSCHLIYWDIDRDYLYKRFKNIGKICKKYGINGHFELDFLIDSKGKWWFMELLLGRFAITDSYGVLQGLDMSYINLIETLRKRDLKPNELKYKAKFTMGNCMFTNLILSDYLKFESDLPNFKDGTTILPISGRIKDNKYYATGLCRLFCICWSSDSWSKLKSHNFSILESLNVPYPLYRTDFKNMNTFVRYITKNKINI